MSRAQSMTAALFNGACIGCLMAAWVRTDSGVGGALLSAAIFFVLYLNVALSREPK